MKYALAAPFIERFFDLAQTGTREKASGFVGMIVGNNFMKRDFGRKLIECVLPRLDLTHIVNCDGVAIPGHGTPTAILFGRNRAPIACMVRTVMGIKGDPPGITSAGSGPTWTAIVAQTDQDGSAGDFVSVANVPRTTLARHPWSIGGGGAQELKEPIEGDRCTMASVAQSVGITAFTLEDDLFFLDARSARRHGIEPTALRPMLAGDEVRDYLALTDVVTVFPYDTQFEPFIELHARTGRHMWPGRTSITNNKMFAGKTKVEAGLKWYEFGRLTADKLRTPLSVTFAFVATHNHFVLDRGGKVYNRSAPVIKLPVKASEDDHFRLLAGC